MPSPLPPDTWSMRETHSPPEGTASHEIMNFYISNIPPGWRWCSRQDDAGYLYGVSFEKGTKRFSVDTQGLQRFHPRLSPSYTVSVSRDNTPEHCETAARRAIGSGLDPIPKGSPGNRTISWAEQYVPFPVWVPSHFPEKYWMSADARLLEGWPYRGGVKGVELTFRNTVGRERDLEAIFVRQFLAGGTSPHARAYRGNLEREETVDLDGFLVKVQEGVEEKLVGDRAWVTVEWEEDLQGKRIVYMVESGASWEETLRMVEPFSAWR